MSPDTERKGGRSDAPAGAPDPRGRRKERAHARNRQDILEAAARVFAREGVAEATMQAIAREAGYTAASLYTYFDSKDALVAGLRELITSEYVAMLDEPTPAGLTFAQALELLVRRNAELAGRRREVLLVFLSLQLSRRFGAAADGRPAAPGLSVTSLTQWMADHAPKDVLARYSARELGELLHGIRTAFVLSWLEAGARKDQLERRVALVVELFLHGVSGAGRRAEDGVGV